MKYYIFLLLTIFMISCQQQDETVQQQSSNCSATTTNSLLSKLKSLLNNFTGSKNDAEKALTAWANAYFNFDYEKVLKYTTPEGEQWIRFAASNITEQDIDFIKEQNLPTQINILNSQLTEGDTICNAKIRVSQFIQLGLSAQDHQVINHADFQIQLVKRGNEWLVRMEGLPQSGKRNHD